MSLGAYDGAGEARLRLNGADTAPPCEQHARTLGLGGAGLGGAGLDAHRSDGEALLRLDGADTATAPPCEVALQPPSVQLPALPEPPAAGRARPPAL